VTPLPYVPIAAGRGLRLNADELPTNLSVTTAGVTTAGINTELPN